MNDTEIHTNPPLAVSMGGTGRTSFNTGRVVVGGNPLDEIAGASATPFNVLAAQGGYYTLQFDRGVLVSISYTPP